jgi:hypothetical protein
MVATVPDDTNIFIPPLPSLHWMRVLAWGAPLSFVLVDLDRQRRESLRMSIDLAGGCCLALNGGNSPTMDPRKFKQFDPHNNKPRTDATAPNEFEVAPLTDADLMESWGDEDDDEDDDVPDEVVRDVLVSPDGARTLGELQRELGIPDPTPLETLPDHFLIVDINTMWLDGARSFLVRQWAANVHQLRWCEDCSAWTNYNNTDSACMLCHGTDNDETGCIRVGCVVDLWQLMNLQQREADKAAVLGFLTMTREAALENIDVAAHLQTTREDTPLDDGDDGLVTTDTDYTADIREALAMFERSIAAGWVWNDTAWDEVGAPYFALARYIATNPDESSPGEFMSLGDDDLSDTGSLGLDDGACLSALQLLLESRACALRSSRHRV